MVVIVEPLLSAKGSCLIAITTLTVTFKKSYTWRIVLALLDHVFAALLLLLLLVHNVS